MEDPNIKLGEDTAVADFAGETLAADQTLPDQPVVEEPDVVTPEPVVYEPGPLGEFPVDELNTSLHETQVNANYNLRVTKLIQWLNGRNFVDAITELLRQYNHHNPELWKAALHPDALKPELDENVRLFLVKRALHLNFIAVTDEDITPVLMGINTGEMSAVWLVVFERHVLPVMVRLGL